MNVRNNGTGRPIRLGYVNPGYKYVGPRHCTEISDGTNDYVIIPGPAVVLVVTAVLP